MTRNYAATLQDDAQQAMNIWLAADVQQFGVHRQIVETRTHPTATAKGGRAARRGALYVPASLQARKLLFLGISEMKAQQSRRSSWTEVPFHFPAVAGIGIELTSALAPDEPRVCKHPADARFGICLRPPGPEPRP
jgi:hypothetical protein